MIKLDLSIKGILLSLFFVIFSLLSFKANFAFLDHVIEKNNFPFGFLELFFFLIDCIVLYLIFSLSFVLSFFIFKREKFLNKNNLIHSLFGGLLNGLKVSAIIIVCCTVILTIVFSLVIYVFTAFWMALMLSTSITLPFILSFFITLSLFKGILNEINDS
jgi:hypothetical protein